MRTNGRCNSSHAPSTSLSSILLSEPNTPEGPEYIKQVAQWATIAHLGASIMFGKTIIYDAQ